MTFADLAQKIINEATPDPRGLRTSQVGARGFNPQLPDYKKIHPSDKIGLGGTMSKKALRNIFRLLKNDANFSAEVNEILTKYARRQTVSKEFEDIISLNIQEIQDKEDSLIAYKKALTEHETGRATLEDPDKVKSRINVLNGKIDELKAELEAVLKKVETFPEDNEVLEQNLRKKLLAAVKSAASTLLKEVGTKDSKPQEVKSLDQLEQLMSGDEELQQTETKIAVLKSLTEENPEKNALLRFFDDSLNKYNEFMKGRSLSGKLATIEQNKQFNMLPLSAFQRFYNANVKDAGTIKLLPMSAGAKALVGGFKASQAGSRAVSPVVIQAKKLLDGNFGSGEEGVMIRALNMFNQGGAGPKTMEKLRTVAKEIIDGVEGSPAKLANIIYGNEGPITESFNGLVEHYLTEAKKGARCTKVTGQQASSRSDKKYMRCARVDGKLKRIHYGDPNLRIKKSNPKKRKSFRARHKCSTAKPGTARYYSCKNW